MLKPLLQSGVKEKVLLFLYTNGEAYPRQIADAFGLNLRAVQYHLEKLEEAGVLYSRLKGKVRLFGFNPRYPFKRELEALLEKSLRFVPEEEKDKFYRPRLRPRKSGKPL